MIKIFCISSIIFIVLFLFAVIITVRKPDGELEIDTSDPDKDAYMFKIYAPLDSLPKRKFIIIKVASKSRE